MLEILRAILVFIVYLIEYYIYGFGFARLCNKKAAPQFYLISGMFVQALLFFIPILPMKLLQVPVHIAAIIWVIIWLGTMLFIIMKWRRELADSCKEWIGEVLKWKLESCIFIIVTGFQIVFDELYGRILGGENAAYYIGYVTSSLFTNSMGTVDPQTGALLHTFSRSYLLQTYLDHSTIVSWLTQLHPLIEIRTVIPAVTILIGNLVIWQFAKLISKGNRRKALYGWLFYLVIYHLFVNSALLPPIYGYFRAFEGKNFFANISMPLIFMCFWLMYEKVDDWYLLWVTVIIIAASFMYCMSTMFIVPFMIIIYGIMVFTQRSWKLFRNLCICMIPCIVVIGYYLLAVKGVIDLAIS